MRKALKLRQVDFCKLVGVSQSRLSQMENGAPWTAEHVAAACEALGCSASDLMDESPGAPMLSKAETALVAAFRSGDMRALMVIAAGRGR